MLGKSLFAAVALLSLSFTSIGVEAKAPCRDAKGKFVKCPEVKPAPVRCRNAKGQFAKCGTPGAKPA
jgi:hypothetical protein